MINKIADMHFNMLRAASVGAQDGERSSQAISKTTRDALDTFMIAPSFSNKQIAIESLLRQITRRTPSS